MASLKELKGRINSVKSTQKITKAKQMVAAAKLRRAQAAAEAARPYAERLSGVMASLAGKVSGDSAPQLLAGNGADDLGRRGSRADDADALARQIDRVVPPRAVKLRASEGVQTLDVGIGWVHQNARSGNDEIEDFLAAFLRTNPPLGSEILQIQRAVSELNHILDAVLFGDVLLVRPDFRSVREAVRPVRVQLERVRVPVRGNVAGEAGIGVVAPGAAEALGALEASEVRIASLA